MIGGSRTTDYLSSEITPVSVSHHIMSHYCMDTQDQAPSRPSSLALLFNGSTGDYEEIKNHQVSRNYHSGKRIDNRDYEKISEQLENNSPTPITPSSFLNPKEITAEQEQFAEQLTKTIDKIKSEREGKLAEDIRLQRPQSHNSSVYVPLKCRIGSPTLAASPIQPIRIKLPKDGTKEVVSSSGVSMDSMMLSGIGSLHIPFSSAPSSGLCSNATVAADLNNLRAQDGGGSPLSSNAEPSPPVSPSLENPTHRNNYPTNRYPSLSLPPLRTDAGSKSGGNYTPVCLTDMLVRSEDAMATPSIDGITTLADLTATVAGQVIVNQTTDGFLHIFHNSTDQNPLMDTNSTRGDVPLSQHMTNLITSYGSQSLSQSEQSHEFSNALQNSYSGQEHQQECLMHPRKRTASTTPAMTPATVASTKRVRRRHEPTIAAAQALINATSNCGGQLSYAQTDVVAMASLKMEEDRGDPNQPPPGVGMDDGRSDGRGRRVSVTNTSVTHPPMSMSYEQQQASMGQSDTSLNALDEELGSDPSVIKIEKKRARNRLAARRCRERKVTRIAALEGEVDLLKAYIERLRSELDSSQKEANQLRLYLEQLVDSYPGLGDKLKALPHTPTQTFPNNKLHLPLPISE